MRTAIFQSDSRTDYVFLCEANIPRSSLGLSIIKVRAIITLPIPMKAGTLVSCRPLIDFARDGNLWKKQVTGWNRCSLFPHPPGAAIFPPAQFQQVYTTATEGYRAGNRAHSVVPRANCLIPLALTAYCFAATRLG